MHTLCFRAAKALVSLHICTGLTEPSLHTDVTSTVPNSHVMSHMLWVILVTSEKDTLTHYSIDLFQNIA